MILCVNLIFDHSSQNPYKPIYINTSELETLIDSLRINTKDSVRVEYIHFNFKETYMKEGTTTMDYAYLFCYLFDHNLEEYDEPIGCNLYSMLEKYPNKKTEIQVLLSQLSERYRPAIKTAFMYILAHEFLSHFMINNSYEIFIKKYPFLDEPYIYELYDENELNPCK